MFYKCDGSLYQLNDKKGIYTEEAVRQLDYTIVVKHKEWMQRNPTDKIAYKKSHISCTDELTIITDKGKITVYPYGEHGYFDTREERNAQRQLDAENRAYAKEHKMLLETFQKMTNEELKAILLQLNK